MKFIAKLIGVALCIVIGAGIAHGITYKDKIKNVFNKANDETKQDAPKEETEQTTASITILSDGTTKIN